MRDEMIAFIVESPIKHLVSVTSQNRLAGLSDQALSYVCQNLLNSLGLL
jgi:pyrrolidone-carboxylate peptidase